MRSEPTNEEDEFDNEQERREAYGRATKLLIKDMERERDQHGDHR